MVLTDNRPKDKQQGFRSGLNQVKVGDYKEVVEELKKALGINGKATRL